MVRSSRGTLPTLVVASIILHCCVLLGPPLFCVGTPWLRVGARQAGLKHELQAEATSDPVDIDERRATREALYEIAHSAPVVVFTSANSSSCSAALEFLDSLEASYKQMVLAERGDGAAKRIELTAMFGVPKLPHVFVSGRSIGGFTDDSEGMLKLHAAGELVPALEKVGAIPDNGPFGWMFETDIRTQTCMGDEFGMELCEIDYDSM